MSWNVQELELAELAVWPAAAKLQLLAVVAALLILSGSYFLLVEPWRLWQQTKEQEVQLERAFIHKRQLTANLPLYQQQLAQLNQQLNTSRQQLPELRQAAELLNELSALAEANGLLLNSVQWQAERALEQTTQLPLQLHLQGDYHQLGQFVGQISALPRLVVIERLEIHVAPAALPDNRSLTAPPEQRLNMTLLAAAFIYPAHESAPNL